MTEKDTAFLLQLKSQGKEPGEALQILNDVKASMTPVRTGKKPMLEMETDEEIAEALEAQKGVFTRGVMKQEEPPGAVEQFVKAPLDIAIGATKAIPERMAKTAETMGVPVPEKVTRFLEPKGAVQETVSKAVGAPLDISTGAAKGVASTTLGIANLLGADGAMELRQKLEPEGAAEHMGFYAEQIGEYLYPSTAVDKGVKMVRGAQILSKYPKLAKIVPLLVDMAGQGAVGFGVTAAQEGEVGKEAYTMGAIGAAIPVAQVALEGVGKLGSKLYQSAFKGTKGQEKSLYQAYGTTVGQTAEQLGYTGSADDIVKASEQGIKQLKTTIKSVSKQSGLSYTVDDFASIADDITKSMTKNIPESALKVQMTDEIHNTVMQYAPTKTATAEQMIGILDKINAEQFVSKSALVPSTSTIEKAIKDGVKSNIKKMLPPEVSGLYQESAMNHTIKTVMSNEVVKKIVARSMVGGGVGSNIAGLSSIAGGDSPAEVVVKAVVAGIGGALIGGLSSNTKAITKTGKAISNLKTLDPLILKSVILSLRTILNDPNE